MAFPFRSRTVGVLIEVMAEGFSHRELGVAFMKAGVNDRAPGDAPNKEVRLQRLFEALMDADDDEAAAGALELARMTVERGTPSSAWGSGAGWLERLTNALQADGWDYDEENDRLVSAVPGVETVKETSLVERELDEWGWDVAAGHYRQALASFSSGQWSVANSQARSLLEALLPEAAVAGTDSAPP